MRLLQHQGGAVTGQVHEALFGALIADGEAEEAVESQTGVQIGADELRDHTRHEIDVSDWAAFLRLPAALASLINRSR